jgi:hypothetical protein
MSLIPADGWVASFKLKEPNGKSYYITEDLFAWCEDEGVVAGLYVDVLTGQVKSAPDQPDFQKYAKKDASDRWDDALGFEQGEPGRRTIELVTGRVFVGQWNADYCAGLPGQITFMTSGHDSDEFGLVTVPADAIVSVTEYVPHACPAPPAPLPEATGEGAQSN